MKKLWRILLVCFMMSQATVSWGHDKLTDVDWKAHPHMVWAMQFAERQGERYGLAYTTIAVIYAESTACTNKVGTDKHSYGCGQLKYRTANTIYRLYDQGTKPISVAALKSNDSLNIIVAAQYLDYCYQLFHKQLHRTLVCYNKGEGAAKNMKDADVEKDAYVKNIVNYIHQLQAVQVSYD